MRYIETSYTEDWLEMKRFMSVEERGDYEDNLENRLCKALSVIFQYGQIKGDHHKAWVLDQVVRILLNNPEMYQNFLTYYKDGEDGPETYEWYTGIAP